jgi:hypothetical protein
MTKGVFALVPIGTSIVGQAIFANQFRQLFRWRWLLAVVFTAIFILPEVYAVYVQFDKHPEKIVFGSETGVSGVKWFLWDSQFSRFVNNGPITRPKGDLFYYVHTLFWAYAPWCLLFYFVFAKRIIAIVKKKKIEEYVTVSAIVPMLLFFSLSKFQLNFYTNILFPFFSILVASFIGSALAKGEKTFYSITQAFYSAVFIIGIMIINFLLKPQYQWAFFFGSVGLILSAIIVWQKANSINLKWLIISCLAVLYINFYLNFTLYPKMSSLKGENQAAAFVNEFYPNDRLGVFQNRRNGFEFYTHQPVQQIHIDEWISGKDKDRIFYVDDIDYPELSSRNAHFKILKKFVDYNSENIVKYMQSTDSTQTPHRGYLIRSQ